MVALGLMGLMIVNMAMDAGQYNETVFTIMVIPGLVSTVIAFPLLRRFYLQKQEKPVDEALEVVADNVILEEVEV